MVSSTQAHELASFDSTTIRVELQQSGAIEFISQEGKVSNNVLCCLNPIHRYYLINISSFTNSKQVKYNLIQLQVCLLSSFIPTNHRMYESDHAVLCRGVNGEFGLSFGTTNTLYAVVNRYPTTKLIFKVMVCFD